ncbi:MAG: substrate-binding domain-containing protein [Cytophagales bacterium]|nr:substrate-binding domain-containing protein [Armatimonadota bacterium]
MSTPTAVIRKPAKHQELTSALRALASSLAPGDRFPSQNELMRRYSVSDRTVLRSLDDLRRDGIIVRQVGSGTFVANNHPNVESASSTTRSETIAVLALASNPFFRHCVDALTGQAAERGLRVICHYANHAPDIPDALTLEALSPVGYLLFSHGLAPVAHAVQARGHRVVVVGMPPVDVAADLLCVGGDQEHGGALAAQYLLDLGHRRIGYLHRDVAREDLRRSRRFQGHCRALKAAGLDLECLPIFGKGDLDAWVSDPSIARQIFAEKDAPTAFAAWTDAEAVEWLSAFRAAEVRVPGDVSIIGYDAISNGALAHPALDTIDSHISAQVRHALELLTMKIPPVTTLISVTPTLLRRSSCAPPRTAVSRSGFGSERTRNQEVSL